MIVFDNPLRVKIPFIALALGLAITWMTNPESWLSSFMVGLCLASLGIFVYCIVTTPFARIRKIEPTTPRRKQQEPPRQVSGYKFDEPVNEKVSERANKAKNPQEKESPVPQQQINLEKDEYQKLLKKMIKICLEPKDDEWEIPKSKVYNSNSILNLKQPDNYCPVTDRNPANDKLIQQITQNAKQLTSKNNAQTLEMSKMIKKERDETIDEMKKRDLKYYDKEDVEVVNKRTQNTDKIQQAMVDFTPKTTASNTRATTPTATRPPEPTRSTPEPTRPTPDQPAAPKIVNEGDTEHLQSLKEINEKVNAHRKRKSELEAKHSSNQLFQQLKVKLSNGVGKIVADLEKPMDFKSIIQDLADSTARDGKMDWNNSELAEYVSFGFASGVANQYEFSEDTMDSAIKWSHQYSNAVILLSQKYPALQDIYFYELMSRLLMPMMVDQREQIQKRPFNISSNTEYSNQMRRAKILALFLGSFLVQPDSKFGAKYAWAYIVRIINTDIEMVDKYVIPLLSGFLMGAGDVLVQQYKEQFKKLLRCIKEEWFPFLEIRFSQVATYDTQVRFLQVKIDEYLNN